MKLRQRLLSIALIAALGLGVWTAAIGYTPAGFSDGDILSADALNSLLNDNMDAISNAYGDLDSKKLNRSGGTLTGRTDISGSASSSGLGDVSTVFRVNNTSSSSGSAAVFESRNESNSGAVSIKQHGTGPALTLKSNGGGPLITGAGEAMVTFIVEDNGSIEIGDMGADGKGEPTLRLDAQSGTITNSVGSGLPLAFGRVDADGTKPAGNTDGWTVTLETSPARYRISFEGEDYTSLGGYATTVTPNSSDRIAHTTGQGGDLIVYIRDTGGAIDPAPFHFVTYKVGD